MPKNTRHTDLTVQFDMTTVDLLKSKLQFRLSIDSLEKVGSIIKKYKEIYDTTHVLTVYWNDETRLQQIVSLLDTLKRAKCNRYAIIPDGRACMIDFCFSKPVEMLVIPCGTSFLEPYHPEPTKTFQQNFDMIFKDYIWVWILFGGLIACTFWKIKQQ